MAIRFNKIIRPIKPKAQDPNLMEFYVGPTATSDTWLFMSHRTGDKQAEIEAEYIANKHFVNVYLAKFDDSVDENSNELPDYIMNEIRKSDGFLVNVIAEIAVSMWIGYEIGGAHAMRKPRAMINYKNVHDLPSVVDALSSIRNRHELDKWIIDNVL